MRRILAVLSVIAVASGCSGRDGGGNRLPTDPEPVGPTFTLSGVIRGEDGKAISGANVVAVDMRNRSWVTRSNESGEFKFVGVAGHLALLASKDDYYDAALSVIVHSDFSVTLQMTRADVLLDIPLGQLLHLRVNGQAPPCDPTGWDARAPCRRLRFTAPESGLLMIDIAWNGEIELDAVIMSPTGQYLAVSTGGRTNLFVNARVERGKTYEIRVNAYYAEQLFDLRAELLAAQ